MSVDSGRLAPETAVDLRRLSPGDARRLLSIVVTFARHGLLVVAQRGSFVALHPREQAPRAVAVALRRSLAELGPTFVKFGQLIASSPGLFPKAISDECRLLLDRMPPEPAERVRAVIERDLGAPVDELFASFDETPLAAASIAQVHAATLDDGTLLAVKVRRPHLRSAIERDLRLMRLLAVLLENAGTLGSLANPVAVIEELAATLRSELDFRNEAALMLEFARNLASAEGEHRVVVPTPVEGMISPRVLVMTFVDGVPIDDEPALRQAGHDPQEVLRIGVWAWVEMALVHGLFHGDVHAGNLLVTPNGEVAFLDFGIVGRIDDAIRTTFYRLLTALILQGDYDDAVEAIFALGAIGTTEVDRHLVATDLERIVQPLLLVPLSEISYGEILSQVLRVASRYEVRLPRELVLVVKQLLYFEGYAKRLAPTYQLLADPAIFALLLGGAGGGSTSAGGRAGTV